MSIEHHINTGVKNRIYITNDIEVVSGANLGGGVVHPYRMIISQPVSGRIEARDFDNNLVFFGSNTSNVFQNVINRVISLSGGLININAGKYTFTSGLTVYQSGSICPLTIRGEGDSTVLNFAPTSALTDAIKLQIEKPELNNLKIVANNNVINLVRAVGHGIGVRRTDYGEIQNVTFDGPNGSGGYGTLIVVSGQVGFLLDGTAGTNSSFFWRLEGNRFFGLHNGIVCSGTQATSTLQNNNVFHGFHEAIVVAGGQHIINNAWMQGNNSGGITAIKLMGLADRTVVNNIVSEIGVSGTNSQTIWLQSGCTKCMVGNVNNAFDDGSGTAWVTIRDDSNSTDNLNNEQYVSRGHRYWQYASNSNTAIFRGTFLEIRDNKLLLNDGAGGLNFKLRIPTLAASRDLSLPTISTSDTIVLADVSGQSIRDKNMTSGWNFTAGTTSGQGLVGSGATALPATPAGYLQINVSGAVASIPYYK